MNISGIRPIGGYQTIQTYSPVKGATEQERVYLQPLEEQDLTQVKAEESDISKFSRARANQTFLGERAAAKTDTPVIRGGEDFSL